NRHQYRPDQSQQRRIFECHGRSMNVASDSRNSRLVPSRSPSQRVGQDVTDRPRIEAIDAIRGKITPNQMNAASPERRPATEEISGLIERVTDFGTQTIRVFAIQRL